MELNTSIGTKTINDLSSFNVRGEWVAGMTLSMKDIVTRYGIAYVALSAVPFASNDLSIDLAAGNVAIFQGATSFDLAVAGGAGVIGFVQSGAEAMTRTLLDKGRDTLSTHDFPNVQAAVNEAISSGRRLIIEPGTALGQITINGRIDIEAPGVTTCDYDGKSGPLIHVAAGADESRLYFNVIDFGGTGMLGILLDAQRCTVRVDLGKNMTAQSYAVAGRQSIVTSQAADNDIDVCGYNFDPGATGGANAVPRLVTTDSGSVRNKVRVRAYKTHTVWVDNGVNNVAEYVIADSVTDNGIYNLSGSSGMKCAYLQYTNSHEEAFVVEGINAHIGQAVYDGWAYPGVQNATNLLIDSITLLLSPDGTPSNCVLRSRDGNVQSDVRIGRIAGSLAVGNQTAIGAFLHLYAGNVDVRIGSIDLKLTYQTASAAAYFVLHNHGSIAEYGDVRIAFDDTAAQPAARMFWQFPAGARFSVRSWQLDPRSYPYLGVSNANAANVFLPAGCELVSGSILQNPDSNNPVSRLVSGTAAPTAGAWFRGDEVHNKFPFQGGALGWKCITSGTPGVWKVAGQAGVWRGLSSSRPNAATMGVANDIDWAGTMYFDTTLLAAGKPIWWSGASWVDANGTAVQ